MDTWESIVRQALVRELDLSIPPEALRLDDELSAPHIRVDSLGYLRLVHALDEKLGRASTDDDLERAVFETVGDVVRWVEGRAQAGRTGA